MVEKEGRRDKARVGKRPAADLDLDAKIKEELEKRATALRVQMEKKASDLKAKAEAREAMQAGQKKVREEKVKEQNALRNAARVLARVAPIVGRLQLALQVDQNASTSAPMNISKPVAKSLKDLQKLLSLAENGTKTADYSPALAPEAVTELLTTAMKHEAALKDITRSLQRICG